MNKEEKSLTNIIRNCSHLDLITLGVNGKRGKSAGQSASSDMFHSTEGVVTRRQSKHLCTIARLQTAAAAPRMLAKIILGFPPILNYISFTHSNLFVHSAID